MSVERLRYTFFLLAGLVILLFAILFFSFTNWLQVQRQITREALPVELWFSAGTPIVEDAVVGTCPSMAFDREINQVFSADWTVTLLKQQPNDGFETYRTFFGGNDYDPSNQLPEDLHLCWWVWVEEAAHLGLRAGDTYRITTTWELDLGEYGERTVRRQSPPFTIYPKEEKD